MRFILSILCVLLLSAAAWSQQLSLDFYPDYSNIQKIVVYHDAIWLKTNGGFLASDMKGAMVKKYNRRDDGVSGKDDLWEGYDGEPFIKKQYEEKLLRWDKKSKQWRTFYHADDTKEKLHCAHRQIWRVNEDSLYLWKAEKWWGYAKSNLPKSKYLGVSFLEQTEKGMIYFKPSWVNDDLNKQIFYGDGETWSSINMPEEGNSAFLFLFRDTLYDSKLNTQWNGAAWVATNKWEPMPDYWFLEPLKAPKGDFILIRSGYNGVVSFDNRKNKLDTIRIEQQFENKRISETKYIDKAGNIWFVDTKQGIYKAENGKVQRIALSVASTTTTILSPNLFFDKKGRVWLANYGGLCYQENNKWIEVSFETILGRKPNTDYESFYMQDMKESAGGNLYVATYDNLFVRNSDGHWESLFNGQYYIALHPQGHIFAVGKRGRYYEIFDNGDIIESSLSVLQNIEYSPLYIIPIGLGEFWVMSKAPKQIYAFKDKKATVLPMESFSEDFSDIFFQALRTKDGSIFLKTGFSDQLFYKLPEASNWEIFTTYSRIDNNGYTDSAGDFWLKHEERIYKYEAGTWRSNRKWTAAKGERINVFLVDSALRLWIFSDKGSLEIIDTKTNNLIYTELLPDAFDFKSVQQSPNGDIWLMGNSGAAGVFRMRLK